MKLKKCPNCHIYTFNKICNKCNLTSKEAHYKYIKIKDAPKSTAEYFLKKK